MFIKILSSLVFLSVLTGCATNRSREFDLQRTRLVMGQERSFSMLSMKGTNLTISISGANEIAVNYKLDPLQAPKSSNVEAIDSISSLVGNAIPWAAMAWVATDRPKDNRTTLVSDSYVERGVATQAP